MASSKVISVTGGGGPSPSRFLGELDMSEILAEGTEGTEELSDAAVTVILARR